MLGKLFGKKAKPVFAYAKINAPLQPKGRDQLFGEPLAKRLEESGLGEGTGGGALLIPDKGIQYCGIDINMFDLERAPTFICESLNRRGAPKGSQLDYEVRGEDVVVPFGVAEGVAVYLNGTDLAPEVYQACDVDGVCDGIQKLIEPDEGGSGCVVESWQGPRETAVYMLGVSAEAMMEAMAPFIAEYPLCQRARVVRFA